MTRRPRVARWPLALLCAVTALTAIAGGALLALAPDGSLLHAPLGMLAHSPFASFLVPGLVLLLVVGGTNAVATIEVVYDAAAAGSASMLAGASLLGWIVIEMIFLHTMTWMQVTYVVIAVAILLGSRRTFSPRAAAS